MALTADIFAASSGVAKTKLNCWDSDWNYLACCYAEAAPCWDEVHTYQACCLQDPKEVWSSIHDLQSSWPALRTVASTLKGDATAEELHWSLPVAATSGRLHGEHHGFKARLRAIRRELTARRSRSRWLAGQRRLARHFLARVRQSLSAPDIDIAAAVDALLAFYAARIGWMEEEGDQHNMTDYLQNAAPELLRMEEAAWMNLSTAFSHRHLAQFDVCACAGKGYDLYLSIRDLVRRLWIKSPDFRDRIGDPHDAAHHLVASQTCPTAEITQGALTDLFQYVGTTTCAVGEAATNIMLSQSCLLNREWQRAAELLIVAFALAIAGPWEDCLNKRLWDFDLQDLVYNAARIAGGIRPRGYSDARPTAGLHALAWRRSPHQLVLNVPRRRCTGPIDLVDGVCVRNGTLTHPPGVAADLVFCTEFGSFESHGEVLDMASWKRLIRGTRARTTEKAVFIVPVGSPFPNLWHALHWWVPALAFKHERGWSSRDIRLALVLHGREASGEARWSVAMEGEFATFNEPILSILSAVPPLYLGRPNARTACFSYAVAGVRSFRYDLQAPETTTSDVAAFRLEAAKGIGLRLETRAGPAVQAASLQAPSLQAPSQLLIVQRGLHGARWISNLADVEVALRSDSRVLEIGIRIHVQIMERLPLLKQLELVMGADILAGAHGAGLAWLVAMPHGSAVLEAMPSELPSYVLCVEGWDHPSNIRDGIYGGLARLAGQHHTCLRGNGSAGTYAVVNFREHPIQLPVAGFVDRVIQAIDVVSADRSKSENGST